MGRQRLFDREAIAKAAATLTLEAVARKFGCSVQTVLIAKKEHEPKPAPPLPARKTQSRHVSEPLDGQVARMPPWDHPALMEGRTIYPGTVVSPLDRGSSGVFSSGENTAKIGGRVLKGAWSGFPIYTLALEERATCPRSCGHWRSCYGNKMHLARRHRHGPELEWAVQRDVAALERAHPDGFTIRLHTLGDFYSYDYVELWRMLLERHPALHVFGYTARVEGPIAEALALTVRRFGWRRFAMRFSNYDHEAGTTVSIRLPRATGQDRVVLDLCAVLVDAAAHRFFAALTKEARRER